MSTATVLGVTPDRRPIELVELRNSHGWSPSVWRRLLAWRGEPENWYSDDSYLLSLWRDIESLPEWQQAPLVLTFDTGVIPWQAYAWAAEMFDEFEAKAPSNPTHVNHVPAMADILRSAPEVPFIGVWGTSVSDNPFDPWDEDADDYGNGIPLSEMYLLERHR